MDVSGLNLLTNGVRWGYNPLTNLLHLFTNFLEHPGRWWILPDFRGILLPPKSSKHWEDMMQKHENHRDGSFHGHFHRETHPTKKKNVRLLHPGNLT